MWHFFVKKFPFFLILSWKVYLMAVNRLVNRTAPGIFKAFKETFQYYLHSEFRITMVHIYEEFRPFKIFIESLPGGALVNLAASN